MAREFSDWKAGRAVRPLGRRHVDGEGLLAGVSECLCRTGLWGSCQWSGQSVSRPGLMTGSSAKVADVDGTPVPASIWYEMASDRAAQLLTNQFGYSFLLHLYSSPLTHHRPPPAANYGRPDVHALFQLWLSLTEVSQ